MTVFPWILLWSGLALSAWIDSPSRRTASDVLCYSTQLLVTAILALSMDSVANGFAMIAGMAIAGVSYEYWRRSGRKRLPPPGQIAPPDSR